MDCHNKTILFAGKETFGKRKQKRICSHTAPSRQHDLFISSYENKQQSKIQSKQ